MATSTIKETATRIFLGVTTVNLSASLAGGASGSASATFTKLNGATTLIPVMRFASAYGVPSGVPSIEDSTLTATLTNMSNASHTIQVSYAILQFKDL